MSSRFPKDNPIYTPPPKTIRKPPATFRSTSGLLRIAFAHIALASVNDNGDLDLWINEAPRANRPGSGTLHGPDAARFLREYDAWAGHETEETE